MKSNNKKGKTLPKSRENNFKQKPRRSSKGRWIFLLIMTLFYLSTFLFSKSKALVTLHVFVKLIIQILPILVIIYLFQLLLDYFVDNRKLKRFMEANKGVREWVIAIIAGILSIGPGYVWYPILKDLRDKSVEDKFLVAFLYNRAIKIPWLPMLILYFGWTYSLVLLIVMVIASIPTAIITEKLVDK